jgi:hypothetical protein
MKKFLRFGLVAMLFIGMTTSLSSCYKKKDTVAIITIVDANGDAVAGVEMTIDYTSADGEHREGLDQTATTDGSGKASFNFNELYKSGQAGVFVLDVFVNGSAVGIIRVEEEVTTEETIVCDAC